MNINLFIRLPFHSVRKSKPAIHTGEGTETISQQRPCPSFGSQPAVIMCFTVMNERANAFALRQRMIQIAGNLFAVVFLKEL